MLIDTKIIITEYMLYLELELKIYLVMLRWKIIERNYM